MAYQSVISHQTRSSFRAIRADYVAICNGAKDPVCAALLLDLAEAWTNHKLDRSEDDTLDGIEIQGDLWFYRSEEKIMADLFNAYGINKLRDNRQWLVKNGLLECQQVPREAGGFTNYYRLPIETIQSKIDALAPVKNNGRLNTKHPLKITPAPVKNNAIREIAKENQEEDILLQSMIAAVKKELKQSNKTQYTAIAKALLGYFTGKDIEKNIVGAPYTPERLLAFCLWWDNCHKDKAGKSLTRPKNQGTVKTWIEAWQEEIKPLVVMETNHPNSSNGKLTPQQAMALEIRMLQDGK